MGVRTSRGQFEPPADDLLTDFDTILHAFDLDAALLDNDPALFQPLLTSPPPLPPPPPPPETPETPPERPLEARGPGHAAEARRAVEEDEELRDVGEQRQQQERDDAEPVRPARPEGFAACRAAAARAVGRAHRCCPAGAASKSWRVDTVVHAGHLRAVGEDLSYRGAAVPPGSLPAAPRDVLRGRRWGSCALVGNSGALLRARHGRAIDAADVVVRLNQAPTRGYEAHVGRKTTARLLNRAWTLGYANSREVHPKYRWVPRLGARNYHPLERGVTLISSRTDPANFAALAGFVAGRAQRPDVRVLLLHRRTVGAAEGALKRFVSCASRLKQREFGGGRTASSGLVGVFLLRELCRSVSVYGLGAQARGGGRRAARRAAGPYQYYELAGTERPAGNAVHSFEAEEAFVQALAREGAIELCGVDGCTSGGGGGGGGGV